MQHVSKSLFSVTIGDRRLLPHISHFGVIRKLIALMLIFVIPALSNGQTSLEDRAKMKSRLLVTQSDTGKFKMYIALMQAYRFSEVDTSLYYGDKAIELSRAMKDPAAEARALSQKGFVLLEMGEIPLSLQCQLAAIRLSEKFSDPEIEGLAWNRVGNIYMELGDYEKAIDNYRKAISLFQSINHQRLLHNEVSNIGHIYELMGKLDSAKYYMQKVYDFSLTNKDRYSITYAEMRWRFGKVEARLGNYDAALMHYRAGITEAYKDVDMNNLALIYVQMAKLLNSPPSNDSSFIYAKSAIETAKGIHLQKAIYEAAALLSNMYKSKSQPDSALVYSELSAVTKDSLYGQGKVQALQRILLEEQQRQQQMQDERDQLRERYRIIALLAALAVLMIIGIILFRNNRQKQKANKVLEATLNNLRSTQSQLIQSEKMASLGELTAGIAHEIENPLNFVNNFSEVNSELVDELHRELKAGKIEEAISISNIIKENEHKIVHHGKRADAIVKGMLQHSQVSSGKKELTDFNALASEYARLASHGLRARNKDINVKLEINLDDSIGKIKVIRQDIGRVIVNLINNAFYAVAERQKRNEPDYQPGVSLSTEKKNGMIEIKVRDNGTGIPQKVYDKIFQPFFTTKPTGEGTGLGLSLAYDIVTKGHGGQLKAESRDGKGSVFTIHLPL